MRIHQEFVGGNIEVLAIEESDIYLDNQLRDTIGDWFYWAFCVEGAEGKTLSFHFPALRLGYFGPAVSHDLKSWTWLGSCDDNCTTFTYTFGEMETKVYFAHSMLYHPNRFLKLAEHLSLPVYELCKSEKGRSIPYVKLGDGKTQIILTSRHHACESTGNYVLEGVLRELVAHPIPDTTIFCVPFVDYDGVVDGDQGKGRAPYDHNRDYNPDLAPIYASTAAIRTYAETYGCHYGFDFHSPWHWGEQNDTVFIVQNSVEKLAQQVAFGKILESCITPDAYPYRQANDFPFGKDWNQPTPSFAHYMTARPENDLAFSLETAYFGTPATETAIGEHIPACPTSPASLIALGHSFARALSTYICKRD